MIRLVVHGAAGRMGARIRELAQADSRFEIVAAIDQLEQFDTDLDQHVAVDVIIDFSADQGTASAVQMALDQGAAILIGTTGLSPQTLDIIELASRAVPVMVVANTSIGIATMTRLVIQAARLLGDEYDVNLIEMHHIHKRDAPSGTALRLAEQLRLHAGVNLPEDRIHSVRAGDIVGEHILEFVGPGERFKIHHIATDRDLFVRGALRLASWLNGRKPGRYTIEHSLDSAEPGPSGE